MGADMCISALACPFGTVLDWAAGRAAIDELSAERIADLVDEFGLDEGNGRETLRSAFVRTREAITDWNRETTSVEFGDWTIYLTGGLSTGDAPTDLYYEFWMLDYAGIAKAIGFDWPTAAAKPPSVPSE